LFKSTKKEYKEHFYYLCPFSFDYLEEYTATKESEQPLQSHCERHINIVILDANTTNTYGQTLVKLLQIYCCKWNCESPIFQRFQVSFIHLSYLDSNV